MSQNPNDPGGTPPSEEPTPPPIDGAEAELPPPNKDERTMALLAHLLGIILSIIGPLIIWVLKKDESKFVDDQAKEAMNFQIPILIGYVISSILMPVCIGFLLFPIIWLIALILGIIGAMQANEGVRYRYPFAWRLIK